MWSLPSAETIALFPEAVGNVIDVNRHSAKVGQNFHSRNSINAVRSYKLDGKFIVFCSINPAAPGMYSIRSDGSGAAKRLTEGEVVAYPASFSLDGKRLAIFQRGYGGSVDIFVAPLEVGSGPGGAGFRLGNPELFLGTPFAGRAVVGVSFE